MISFHPEELIYINFKNKLKRNVSCDFFYAQFYIKKKQNKLVSFLNNVRFM